MLQVTYRAPADLKPYARNSRTHSKAQVETLARSISTYGFTNPILLAEDGTIIAGHGRLQAAIALGLDQVPTITLSGLSDAQQRALVLADNRIALDAGWDVEMLQVELADLKADGFDLSLTGFSLEELDSLLAPAEDARDPDDAPALPAEPTSKPGDVYVMGPHRLIVGDSTDVGVLQRLMDGAFADIVWTDPPYNVAFGAPSVERSFARYFRSTGLKLPIVFTWLEALDLGGHSVLTWTDAEGCLDCLYRDDEGQPSLSPRTAYLEPGQAVTRNLTGCASAFVPFGALQARRTGLMAAEHILGSLGNPGLASYRFWVGEGAATVEAGLKMTRWHQIAATVSQAEGTRRVFGRPCKRRRKKP